MFAFDEALLVRVREVLAGQKRCRFILGGAGTGKTTVCAALADRHRLEILDMDARLYGSWHGRFDAVRHPANHAWSGAANPLAWQLALEPEAFLQFQAAATVEALDLLADELARTDDTVPVLVDGGFGSLAVVARAVPPGSIVCLALPPGSSEAVWTADPGRRGFLAMVAAVETVPDPVANFLALDAVMAERMVADARSAGVVVIERAPGTPLDVTAGLVAAELGLG